MSEQRIEVGEIWKHEDGWAVSILGIDDLRVCTVTLAGGLELISLKQFRNDHALLKNADGTPVEPEPESEYEELLVSTSDGVYGARRSTSLFFSLVHWQKRTNFDGFKYANGTVTSVAPRYKDKSGFLWNAKRTDHDYETVWPTHVVIKKEADHAG